MKIDDIFVRKENSGGSCIFILANQEQLNRLNKFYFKYGPINGMCLTHFIYNKSVLDLFFKEPKFYDLKACFMCCIDQTICKWIEII